MQETQGIQVPSLDWEDPLEEEMATHSHGQRSPVWHSPRGLRVRRACVLSRFSCLLLFVTLWAAATQVLCLWDYPSKNTEVGCSALFHGIFPAQGSNPHLLHLLHWQGGSLPPEPPGKPKESDWLSNWAHRHACTLRLSWWDNHTSMRLCSAMQQVVHKTTWDVILPKNSKLNIIKTSDLTTSL